MGRFYCSRAEITDVLESLADSELATAAAQDAKLRDPASRWIEAVYPNLAPFPPVSDGDPQGWYMAGTAAAGATELLITGGSGTPAARDLIRPTLAGVWYEDGESQYPPDQPMRTYQVTAWDPIRQAATIDPAAEYDIPIDTPVPFGTPTLVRQACRLYATGLAYQIIRKNPIDELATAMFAAARDLLGMGEKGRLARADAAPGLRPGASTVAVIT